MVNVKMGLTSLSSEAEFTMESRLLTSPCLATVTESGQIPAHSLTVSSETEYIKISLSSKANMIKLVLLPLRHLG